MVQCCLCISAHVPKACRSQFVHLSICLSVYLCVTLQHRFLKACGKLCVTLSQRYSVMTMFSSYGVNWSPINTINCGTFQTSKINSLLAVVFPYNSFI